MGPVILDINTRVYFTASSVVWPERSSAEMHVLILNGLALFLLHITVRVSSC